MEKPASFFSRKELKQNHETLFTGIRFLHALGNSQERLGRWKRDAVVDKTGR